MTPDEAIAKWRQLTTEQFHIELSNDSEFRIAYVEAVRLAFLSGDPKRKFWEVDATGCGKKQYNVAIPPARPDDRKSAWPDWMKPIAGAAFPT